MSLVLASVSRACWLSLVISSCLLQGACGGKDETDRGKTPVSDDSGDSGSDDAESQALGDDEGPTDGDPDETTRMDGSGGSPTLEPDVGVEGPDDGPNVDPAVTLPEACSAGPGRVGLQRLTRSEYNRTVRDLFGVTSNPADAFPPDSLTGGFDNNASSLGVSPQSFELWLDAAESVAAEAMQNRSAEIVTCDAAVDGFDACGRDVLETLGLRVYRRPLSEAEIDSIMRFVELAEAEGESFESGIEGALAAMLVSPQFVYRNVPTADVAPGVTPLDDFAIGTRLSYFLWGSSPDDALLTAARSGSLGSEAGLRAEFDRMLASNRADALYDGFFRQWLALGKLGNAWPDPNTLPAFSDEVRQQMWEETRLFFADVKQRDESALTFITSRRTFANELLAELYGVSGVTGSTLVPIDTDPTERAGVLTMPAILTMTSDPDRTNIVRRGAWVAETILCAAPPPPPEDVPPLPATIGGETERQRLERHRADPTCSPCHDLIDPLGFAFESYDAVGRFRDSVDGEPTDVDGQLPDGQRFSGVVGLVELLEGNGVYKTCVSGKLMSYALGRVISAEERCLLEAIGEQTVDTDSRLSDLLWAVVTSDAFQRQTAETP